MNTNRYLKISRPTHRSNDFVPMKIEIVKLQMATKFQDIIIINDNIILLNYWHIHFEI